MISARRIAAWQLPCQYFIYIHKLGQLNGDAAWLKLAKEKTEVTNFRLIGRMHYALFKLSSLADPAGASRNILRKPAVACHIQQLRREI